jgi:hypothetical protein
MSKGKELEMSIFGKILEKLGIKKPAAPTPKPVTPTAEKGGWKPGTGSTPFPVGQPKPGTPVIPGTKPVNVPIDPKTGLPKPPPIEMVDVMAKLEALSKASPEKLDWKVSIVDLLKLLGIDSSLKARKELATELACPPELMADSAKMNTWLHKTVLRLIAENGGNIPKELLD